MRLPSNNGVKKSVLGILSAGWILAIVPPTAFGADKFVEINQNPLSGVGIKYSPNLVLALSVEFPTAGAAYSDSALMSLNKATEGLKKYYRGYFDNKKCYQYRVTNSSTYDGYFYPSSRATTSGGMVGLCAGSEEYSGNLLNWITMSAIDIFRSTMTGGNRAVGRSSNTSDYQLADTSDETLLRRANVVASQNGAKRYRLGYREIDVWTLDKGIMRQLLPHAYADYLVADSLNGDLHKKGDPSKGNFKDIRDNGLVPGNDAFADGRLYFHNDGFTVRPLRKIKSGSGGEEYYAYSGDSGATVLAKALTVAVKVCDSAAGLEENCVQYGSAYKPEGLLQKYGRSGMRVAALGYLNEPGNGVDGGVLRSRMKYLHKTENTDGKVYGMEWDASSGRLVINPDTSDASVSSVVNSGVINYLNKFGDVSGYKTNDPGAELYYTALRYLRHKGLVYKKNNLNPTQRDGFPVIYDWDDPLKRGFAVDSKEPMCRVNNIVYIGDTNTHDDRALPNFGGLVTNQPIDDIQTQTYLETLLEKEGLDKNTWSANRGAVNSPAGIAGLAYWARVNDIRTDIPGKQYGNNFMIDVVEDGGYKAKANAYYWAAKYGGFDFDGRDEVKDKLEFWPEKRNQWTDDAPGVTSIPAFTDGVPRNFAIANSPDTMVKALEKAFANSGNAKDPSQAAVGFSVGVGNILNFDENNKPIALQSAFNADDWSGDVIASTVSFDAGAVNPVKLESKWRAATMLNAAYHNDSSWSSRKVFTLVKQTPTAFTQSNAAAIFKDVAGFGTSINPSEMTAYMLGSPAKEDDWRKRHSIMGTVINSSIQAILKPNTVPAGCRYENESAVLQRDVHYAVAANDGMLHIFNKDGKETLAYLPAAVLPKLPDYVQPKGHMYLNDGTPVSAELCFGSRARSVLIGTTGRGAASVYALDVTNLNDPDTDNVLWEFSSADDDDLGLTVAKPILTNNTAGRPIAIISSGYNSGKDKGWLFILDIGKARGTSWTLGSNYWKVQLGSGGVGAPFAYDANSDGIADTIFVGDADGKVWQADREGSSDEWKLAYDGQPLFTPTAAEARPITGAPYAQRIHNRLHVAVGTGQYFNLNDFDKRTQNYAYGLFVGSEAVSGADLLQQELIEVVSDNRNLGRQLWRVSEHLLNAKHKGWRLSLRPGQAIVAAANIRKQKVAEFFAVDIGGVKTDGCGVSGSTSIISVDTMTGGMYRQAIFDTNLDNQVDGADMRGGMMELLGVINPEGRVMVTNRGTLAIIDGKKDDDTQGGDKDPTSLRINDLNDAPGVRRLSWREIF